MRRTKLVLAALAVMVAAFAAVSGPAMADDLNCRDARGNLIRCDDDLYAPVDNSYNDYWYVYNPYFYNPYWYDNYYSNSDCIGVVVGNDCLGVG